MKFMIKISDCIKLTPVCIRILYVSRNSSGTSTFVGSSSPNTINCPGPSAVFPGIASIDISMIAGFPKLKPPLFTGKWNTGFPLLSKISVFISTPGFNKVDYRGNFFVICKKQCILLCNFSEYWYIPRLGQYLYYIPRR